MNPVVARRRAMDDVRMLLTNRLHFSARKKFDSNSSNQVRRQCDDDDDDDDDAVVCAFGRYFATSPFVFVFRVVVAMDACDATT